MLVSLCGTPGTGKTTASALLSGEGTDVRSLGDLVRDLGLGEGYDTLSGSTIVDIDRLRTALEAWAERTCDDLVLEGHLSYLAPADLCLVLRLDPDVLYERLKARGYPEEKCRENAEAEFVGTLLSWAAIAEAERLGGRAWEDLAPGCGIVLERDVTGMGPASIAEWVREMINSFVGKGLNALRPYRPGKVDWLEVRSPWY
jgi:adenylate kinase